MFSAFQTFGRLGASAGRSWSESALWPLGASSPGLWIEPSYVASCYQDSAGTTALSTVGTVLDSSNPVGLVLDRKGGLALGPELVTNGDFSNGTTGWTPSSTTLTIVSGGLQIDTANGQVHQQFSTTTGKTYKLTFDAPVLASGYLHVGTPAAPKNAIDVNLGTTTGAKTFYFVATGTTTQIRWQTSLSSGIVIDNVSVKEVPGLHLSQSTSAARPVASGRVNLLTYSEDFSNAVWIVQGATKTTGVTAPDGTSTAMTLSITSNTGNNLVQLLPGSLSLPRTASAMVRGAAGQKVFIGADDAATQTLVTFTGEWQEVENTQTASGDVYFVVEIYNRSGGDHLPNVTFDIWHPQINLGSTALPYQRVGAASDYTATNFPVYTKFDGTDDALASATFAAGTLTSSMDCLIAVRRDSTANTIVGGYGLAGYGFFGAAQSGSSFTAVDSVAGTPTVWVDGTQLTGGTSVTRSTFHTALTAGSWHIVEFRGLDLSTWQQIGFGNYSGYQLNGALGKVLLFNSGQDANRDKARAEMAAYFGVTLP